MNKKEEKDLANDSGHLNEETKQTEESVPVKCANCEKIERERDEYMLGWQRAVADYQNLQKETVNRREELVRMSELSILEDFIPVYGNFKKAFSHGIQGEGEAKEKQWQNWQQGIGFIMKQFGDILKNYNIEEIKTVGEKFDPVKHEVIGEEDSDKDGGEIIREVEGGFMMNDRVVKVAKVIVAKHKE